MEAEGVATDGYVVVMRVTHTTHVPSTNVRLGHLVSLASRTRTHGPGRSKGETLSAHAHAAHRLHQITRRVHQIAHTAAAYTFNVMASGYSIPAIVPALVGCFSCCCMCAGRHALADTRWPTRCARVSPTASQADLFSQPDHGGPHSPTTTPQQRRLVRA